MKRAYRLQDAVNNPSVEELFLNHQALKEIPKAIFKLNKLKKLDLSFNQITTIPEEIGFLPQLEELNLSNNKLKKHPQKLATYALKKLDLSHNALQNLPQLSMPKLENLQLQQNALEELPVLKKLRKMNIEGNFLKKLPSNIHQMQELKELYLNNNSITRLPKSISQLTKLEKLEANKNRLAKLPEDTGQLQHLRILRLAKNRIKELPSSLWECPMLRILELDFNKITHLPKPKRGTIPSPWLAQLSLRKNKLSRYPEMINHCLRLKTLDLSENDIPSIPKGITQLSKIYELYLKANQISSIAALPPEIVVLDVSKNKLTTVPKAILDAPKLKSLNLSSNQINAVPEEIQQLQQLQTLNLSNNAIEKPSKQLLQLKNLEQTNGIFNKNERHFFQKIQTYSNENRLSNEQKNRLFELLNHADTPSKWQLEDTFHLMLLGFNKAYYLGRKLLFKQEQEWQLEDGIHIAVLGQLNANISWWKQKLKEKNISISRSIQKGKDNYLLVGRRPKGFADFLDHETTIISEQQLFQFVQKHTSNYLLEAEDSAYERIAQMLHHEDDQNVKMGLELIKNGGLPNGLLTTLLLTYLQQNDEKLKKECWNLLNLAVDDETIQVIQYPKHLWQKNENSKKKFIQRLVKTGWFEKSLITLHLQ